MTRLQQVRNAFLKLAQKHAAPDKIKVRPSTRAPTLEAENIGGVPHYTFHDGRTATTFPATKKPVDGVEYARLATRVSNL